MLRPNRFLLLLLSLALVGIPVAACSKGSSNSNQGTSTMATSAGNSMMMAMGDAAHGKKLFTQDCASCHGSTGREGGIGPSLKNEKLRKNNSQTIAWIKDPQPPMPKLYPASLSDKDVADLAAFVQSL
jgi:mono/diheme cytochrome c family protein